jgi:hypothetical protein
LARRYGPSPLSGRAQVRFPRRAFEITRQARELSAGNDFLFPGPSIRKPLSNMVGRMKLEVTAHGFQSAFRDWVGERTSFPNEIAEMALALTEIAYRRWDPLEKRRTLMEKWFDSVVSRPVGPESTEID